MEIKPIARIETDFSSKFGIPRQSRRIDGLKGKIIFEGEYKNPDYIRSIEQYSHLWIIWGFSENESAEKHPTVRPPRLGGNERIGVFATRSPFRPNNLALSCVKLIEVHKDGNEYTLIIEGADMLNNSPVYDIKPYIPYTDSVPKAEYGFAKESQNYSLDICDNENILHLLPDDKRSVLKGILADDPRPSYQNDSERIYGLEFAGFEIKFRVENSTLYVISAEKINR